MNKSRYTISRLPALLRQALNELLKNDPLRLAGATAFFTSFALPPILVILIQVFRLVLDANWVRRELFQNLSEIVGPETVRQIREVLISMRELAGNWWITIAGFIFLLFVATTLFKVIKNSLNQVWKIRPLQHQGFARQLKSRAQSILVIIIAGILFMLGIAAETIQAFVGRYIFEISPLLSLYFNTVLNYLVSVVVVTLWFAVVFRYLPDGRPEWPVALAGGFFTAVLFSIGRLVLHWLLSYSNITTLYGTSASIVLLLLFVFYSSLILYYGAAFTKVWGHFKDRPIRPLPHAMHYQLIEAEIPQKKAGE